jgi:AcrR family transcriptional regulator
MTDRRTALLNAAIEQIAARGTRGLRVDEVARSAGASTALIYHYYGDRSTFLKAALEHIGNRADTYTAATEGLALEMLLDVLTDEIQDDPEVRTNSAAWGELRDSAVFDPELRPTIARLTRNWIDDIADLIRAGHADGSIHPDVEPLNAGVALSALVEGISGRWLTDQMTVSEGRTHLRAAATALLNEHQASTVND